MHLLTFLVLVFGPLLGQQNSVPQFRMIIAAENRTVVAGNDVWIRVSLTNLSGQGIDDSGSFSDRTGLDPNLHFEIWDNTGKLHAQKVYPDPELDTGSPVNRTIAPGETFAQDQRVSALYDMRKPGRYTIQVSVRIPQSGEIKSNSVTITVQPVRPKADKQ